MEILVELAKNETQSLVNLVKKEAQYLCCFNSYVQDYDIKRGELNARLQDVRRIIDKARGASHVTFAAIQWTREAEELIAVAVEAKKDKCFNGLCLNCCRQYRKGRDLAKKTLDINKLLERCNFDIVVGPTDLPGIKYRCLPTFMRFESRKSAFEDIKNALKDEENNMIGLQGLGGTGKTSMATEVGAELEGSTFGKVIFLVVSKPPDFKKLRTEIARKLDLKLEDEEEELHKDKILTKINASKERLLIVLDDVWEEFNLTKELGIPPCHLHKGLTVLITTRNKDICSKMECQRTIHLDALTHMEALSLFLKHTNNSSSTESLAPKIVEHCHGVPVVIVAVARSLKGRPSIVWKEALNNLQSGESILKVRDDDLKGVYEALKLSYDSLKNEKAKNIFLVTSLFPEDSLIPMELLIRIGIGISPFGEGDDYKERRRKVLDAIMELLDSSLLLNAEEESVKIHDLVREVALLVGEKDIQSVIESGLPVKTGLQCLFWKNHYLPELLDCRNLEILLMHLVLDDSEDLQIPDTFFAKMTKIKVLLLRSRATGQILAPSLLPSIQSLQDIRTLNLVNLVLSSISVLGKLPNLEALWLDHCSIIKLPRENFELQKLSSLRIQRCGIKMSNPFELIEACPQLVELIFFSNKYDEKEEEDEISQKVSFHSLQIYQISNEDLSNYFEQYGSLSRCFQPGDFMYLISEATLKQLARTAELLILEGNGETKQKNLIPDIVPVDDQGTTDLIILELKFCPGMQCLTDAMNNRSDVNAFSNLVKLFLQETQLSNILFNGNYKLSHLKIMTLKNCPKLTSIFLASTAQSLSQLEELMIQGCDALECIVEDKSSRGEIAGDSGQKSYGPLFPKLKILVTTFCGNLEMLLPTLPSGGLLETITLWSCDKLKYMFDKFQDVNVMLPSMKTMTLWDLPSFVGIFREYKRSISSSSLQQPASAPSSSKTRSFSWAQVCCFKLRATSDEANGAVSTGRSLEEGIPQELDASTDGVHPFHGDQSLLVQSLKTVREMKLVECYSLISLSTLSIATSTMPLENLIIRECHKLKCIATNDRDAQGAKKCCSIFPRLETLKIGDCKELEFLFISTISSGLEKLKSLTIEKVPELKYVVGNYQEEEHSSNQNQIDELRFDLPTLETLYIEDAPKMNSICPKNYKLLLSSPLNFHIGNCDIKSFTTQERDASTDGNPPLHLAKILLMQLLKTLRKIELENCQNLISLATLSFAASTMALEDLLIWRCDKLKCITAYEDAGMHMNYNSIFPKLKELHVSYCDALEYLFPACAFRSPLYLESLRINTAPMLKYVFGRRQHEDILIHENQINQVPINFSALSKLSIWDVPQLVSICPENYYLRGLSLRSISLRGFPMSPMRLCNEFFVFWHTKQQETKAIEMRLQTLEKLDVDGFKVKEILDLTHVDMRQNGDGHEPLTSSLQWLTLSHLSELEHICVGPKRIMCFHSLQTLRIYSCKKLKVIFSASVVRSLPMLKKLDIIKCEELVHIIEEDYVTNDDDHLGHEPCFPNLEEVFVYHCDKLKYLFSVTLSGTLPKLRNFKITEARELEHVLIRRGEMKEMVMKDVLPQLEWLWLTELPNLISLCHGIDIRTLADRRRVDIRDCPNFSYYEISAAKLQTRPESADSEAKDKAEEKLSSHHSTEQYSNMGDATQQSLTNVPIHTSPNLTVLPARDNTQASAKNFVEKEEEEGGLITSRHPRIGMKASSSFSEEKFETSLDETSTTQIQDDLETAYFEVEEKADEKLSSQPRTNHYTNMGEGSTQKFISGSISHTKVIDARALGVLWNGSHDNSLTSEKKVPIHTSPSFTVVPTGDHTHPSAQIFEQEEEEEEQGGLMTSRRPRSVMNAGCSFSDEKLGTFVYGDQFVPVATISSEQTWEAILPLNPMSSEASTSFNQTRLSILPKLSDDSQPRRAMSTTSFINISQHESSKEHFLGNLNSTVPPRGPSSTVKRFEEGGFITTHRHGSDVNVTSYLPVGEEYNTSIHGNPFVSPMPFISSEEQASEMILPASLMPSTSALTSPQPFPMSTPFKSTYGRNVQENVETTNQPLNQNFSQFALRVAEVQDIVDIMKVEGLEAYRLAEALNTYPQLLSLGYRSTELLRCSYRVLLNILNILTTRSPITITEADKRLLLEHLNDASVLGFDRDWIDSIMKNVIDYDVSEAQRMQQVLQDLGNKLHNKKSELANAYEGLGEAQIEFNVAQQKHANAREHHSQLLQECQEILEQRDQCWETIAAQFRPFGI